jgi:copper chaperone NosL
MGRAPASLRLTLAGTLAVLLLGCGGREPQPIAFGEENCDYCRMTISDPRFGAELVTATGKVRKFDSVECLASFHLANRAAGSPRGLWVSDFDRPGTLVPADSARFVGGGDARSPMGLGLVAFATEAGAEGMRRRVGGETMRWGEVLELVEQHRMQLGAEPAAPGDTHGGGHAAH